MLVCKCGYKRYTKRNSKLGGTCPICKDRLVPCDGRLRHIVESLNRSDYLVAFAYCETYTTTGMCTAEIIIGFASDYDDFIFQGLPEHFEFITDKYCNPSQYTLNYVLNHLGVPMSMLIFDYSAHPDRSEPATKVLKDKIEELSKWALDIETTAKWAVYKLGAYL